jgi:hypothetical protein
METVLALIGVVLGAALAPTLDWQRQRSRRREERRQEMLELVASYIALAGDQLVAESGRRRPTYVASPRHRTAIADWFPVYEARRRVAVMRNQLRARTNRSCEAADVATPALTAAADAHHLEHDRDHEESSRTNGEPEPQAHAARGFGCRG